MDDLVLAFDFIVATMSDYILALNSFWLTQIILYLVLLSIVVSTILIMRGR